MVDHLLETLPAALDLAVLEPAGARTYRCCADLPAWWHQLDPTLSAAAGEFSPYDELPFLAEFLDHLGPVWQEGDQWLRSGRWQEVLANGESLYLEASARRLMGRRILVIQRNDTTADELIALIQLGRENKLEYQRDLAGHERLAVELRKAQHAAEDLSRAKSEFLAKMSHELRTPMNGVIGMSELLLESNPTPQQRGYLEAVRDSGRALLELINDILDFSKAEAGKLELVLAEFSLRETIGDTLRLLAFTAHDRQLDLVYVIPEDVPDRLEGDPLRLRQALVNLIGNAIKFTESGEVRLEIQREPRSTADCQLRFTVRDTGIGIPADKRESIFDAFAQADDSARRRFEGTGLGLSITRELVELMSGRIWIANSSKDGTTICFNARFEPIPPPAHGSAQVPIRISVTSEMRQALGQAETGEDSVAGKPAPDSLEPAATHGDRIRVLLAEDNPINCRVATTMLEKRGYGVRSVTNGREVLTAMEEEHFDVVLMDCQMPGMDGFEAARAIRQQEQSSGTHIPIIALTAQVRDEDRMDSLAAGMDRHTTKPLDVAELDSLIRELTRKDLH